MRIQKIAKYMGLFAILSLLAGAGQSLAGEAIVIANVESGAPDTIDATALRSLMLGKKKKWDNGPKVVIVVMKDGDLADSFFRSVLGKSAKQFVTYWKKMVFTGKGSMPKLFDDEKKLVEYVRDTRGAIGVVSEGTPVEGVKTLSVSP